MKVIDHVNRAINSYPTLYMYDTYEDSKFAVMHHCYFVLGNGMEWANTGNPKTGGYMVSPQYKKVRDEWVRKKDKPYGREKCELDPIAFKEKVFYFEEINKEASKRHGMAVITGAQSISVFESDLVDLKKKFKVCDKEDEYIPDFHTHYYFEARSNGKGMVDPYPYFEKTHSPFWEIEPELIQEDWRIAGVEQLKFWQEYFNDEERVKSYHYYKNPDSLEVYIIKYYKNKPDIHPNWIQDVRDGYEVPEFDGENFEELADIRWQKDLKKTKEFISETLERIII